MTTKTCALLGLTVSIAATLPTASRASAAILWNNGTFVTHPGGGWNGADASFASNNVDLHGVDASMPISPSIAERKAADDFVVGAGGWSVNSITGYGIMRASTPTPWPTDPPSTSPITNIKVEIWNAVPTTALSPIATSTTIVNNEWAGAYRTLVGGFPYYDSAIFAVTADFGSLILAPGTYWVSFQYLGLDPTNSQTVTEPFVMTTDVNGNPVTVAGNARRYTKTASGTQTWTTARFSTSGPLVNVEFPFLVNGTAIPAPGGALLLGLGGLIAARRRRD